MAKITVVKVVKLPKLASSLVSVVVKVVNAKFAPYVVLCGYGTKQYVWSVREGKNWLGYCSSGAVVLRRSGVFGVGRLVLRLVSNDGLLVVVRSVG